MINKSKYTVGDKVKVKMLEAELAGEIEECIVAGSSFYYSVSIDGWPVLSQISCNEDEMEPIN